MECRCDVTWRSTSSSSKWLTSHAQGLSLAEMLLAEDADILSLAEMLLAEDADILDGCRYFTDNRTAYRSFCS